MVRPPLLVDEPVQGLGQLLRIGVLGDVPADRDPEDVAALGFGEQEVGVDMVGVQSVLEVVHRIRHVVGPVHDLGLEALPVRGRSLAGPFEDRQVVLVDAELHRVGVGGVSAPRPGVFGGGVQGGAGEIEADADEIAVRVVDEALGLDTGQQAQ